MTTTNRTSHPIALRDATVTDPFWASRQELVRTQVIPYQWNALNDNVPGAAPSYCMHNFKAAAAQNAEHHKEGKAFVPPKYTFRRNTRSAASKPCRTTRRTPIPTSSTASCSKTLISPNGSKRSATR